MNQDIQDVSGGNGEDSGSAKENVLKDFLRTRQLQNSVLQKILDRISIEDHVFTDAGEPKQTNDNQNQSK
jgi:hypothetical protein